MINGQPLCGQDWYLRHRFDYTQADIEAQTIVVSVDGKKQINMRHDSKTGKGIIKELVKMNRERSLDAT